MKNTEVIQKSTKGVCTWFNREKGFGFIEDSKNVSYFAHYSDIQMKGYKLLTENSEYLFDVVKTSRGLKAVNIVEIL